MANTLEIERKFLIKRPLRDLIREEARKQQWVSCENIEQAYLPRTGKWTIRGRRVIVGEDAMKRTAAVIPRFLLTMKRKLTDVTNVEIETPIDAAAYESIKLNSGHEPINKNRWYFYIKVEDHEKSFCFMVDEFLNQGLEGLVMAEIELDSEDQWFPRPEWLGEEVTGQKKYGNANMAERLAL